jgi:hypothetical protein
MPRYDKQFRSYDFFKSTRLLKFCLDRIGSSEQFGLLTPKPMQSQETSNYIIVDNFLSFQMHPHATYLVKSNQNYCNKKTARKREFQPKAGNRFEVGVR